MKGKNNILIYNVVEVQIIKLCHLLYGKHNSKAQNELDQVQQSHVVP